MALPSFENVLLDRTGTDDRIGRITLNRPEKMNALSQELIYDFRDALEYFEADDDVRVLIVKGAGRTFSAGYDLTPPGGYGADAVHRKFRTVDEDGNRLIMGIRGGMARVTDIWLYFWNMQKVTIAQLHRLRDRRRLRTLDDGRPRRRRRRHPDRPPRPALRRQPHLRDPAAP